MSKECPNPKVIKCRNCDEIGHTGRECPKPKDCKLSSIHSTGAPADQRTGSRVQCSNCQQFGHTKVRCKEPTAEEPDDAGVDNAGGFGDGSGGGDTWVSTDAAAGTGDDGGW